MPRYVLWNFSREVLLAPSLRVVRGLWQRVRQLLRFRPPGPGEAILLLGCRAVPAYLMRQPLDLLILDDRGYVVATIPRASPMRLARLMGRASDVVALPANSLQPAQVSIGDRISLVWIRPPTE